MAEHGASARFSVEEMTLFARSEDRRVVLRSHYPDREVAPDWHLDGDDAITIVTELPLEPGQMVTVTISEDESEVAR